MTHKGELKSTELNGRPSHVFKWEISERQFRVSVETPTGPELIAESSSMATFDKCVAQMLAQIWVGK